jgi:hypothetical protein
VSTNLSGSNHVIEVMVFVRPSGAAVALQPLVRAAADAVTSAVATAARATQAVAPLAVAAAAGAAAAVTSPGVATAADPVPTLAVHRAAGEIRLDGDLSDPGWQGAAVLDQFWETQPGDNVPPKATTVAMVAYDDARLYIALRCDDPDPSRIRAPFVERDQVVGTDDNVAVFLDTRGDGQTAVELRVNPRGQQADAVFNDASRNEDFSPDFFYDTAARITESGWAAEMRIPFSSLRYPKRDVQEWRILVWRNYPREYRYFLQSRPIPRGSDCLVCHAQPLSGLSGLPGSGGLVLAPYASGQEVARAGSPGEPHGDPERSGDVGLDVKWQPSAGQALDATLNPDFSQVESDVAQIAVNNRFALFYPEKRPFFMEGVELFDTPVQAVYTRTITSPRWGGRATGRLGAMSYALLAADDRGGGSVILPGPAESGLAPQDFGAFVGIARVRYERGMSYAGALFSGREVDGGAYNRVAGPDLLWRPGQSDRVSAQLLWSETLTPDRPDLAEEWDGRKLSGHGFDLSWNHQQRRPFWMLQYHDFGDGFRADTGFVPRVGYREGRATLGWSVYPEGLIAQAQPHVVFSYSEDRGGAILQRLVEPGVMAVGRRNLQAFAGLKLLTERTGDALLSTTSLEFGAQVDPSRTVTRLGIQGTVGEAVDLFNVQVGHGVDLTATATVRPHPRLTLDLVAARRWLDVPRPEEGGDGRLFTADVLRVKALAHFSSRAYLRLIGQWVETRSDPALFPTPVDPRDGGLQGSALFTYQLNWQTALYAGYGDERALDERDDLRRTSRQLFAKISYAFQW